MTCRNRFLVGILLLHFALPSVAQAVGTGGESAEALYERAVATAQSGRYWAAAGLFDEAVLRFPVDHPLHSLSVYGAARANQRLDTSESACKAIDRFGEFMALANTENEKRRIAKEGLEDPTRKCDRQAKGPAIPLQGSLEQESENTPGEAVVIFGGLILLAITVLLTVQ